MARQNDDEVRKRLMREAAEEALREAAEKDPGVARWLDDDLDKGFQEILGMTPKKLQEELGRAIPEITEKDTREALAALDQARRAAKGGFFSSPNPAEAERILMGVRGIREVKKSKENKSCFLFALVLFSGALATIAGLVYGAVEAVAAILP